MKIVDIKSRNEKQFLDIQRKVKAFVKTVGCNTRRILFSNEGMLYFIEVDNDGELATELSSFIENSPNGVVLEKKDFVGVYDWKSDTYIPPCSVVTFKFT